jgi:hypothetical protein
MNFSSSHPIKAEIHHNGLLMHPTEGR